MAARQEGRCSSPSSHLPPRLATTTTTPTVTMTPTGSREGRGGEAAARLKGGVGVGALYSSTPGRDDDDYRDCDDDDNAWIRGGEASGTAGGVCNIIEQYKRNCVAYVDRGLRQSRQHREEGTTLQ
uniref:Uncharacterized protein n=1 Tax=Oryza sativa subsp. japonica TaxID=39947 RepID=Q8GS94_ORYSJ|nr:hypothetical protein [Oryza sativa Japonica Group]BAC16117.1 hypothetical protein [Oryza sativa Japonica Group]